MTTDLRDMILDEIKRLASENGGVAPGVQAFTKATGITAAKWSGVYWSRWGDALAEVGLEANELQKRFDTNDLTLHLAKLTRTLSRLPTRAEIKLQRRTDPAFPSHSTLFNHFPSNARMIAALRELAANESYGDLLGLLPPEEVPLRYQQAGPAATEGVVYLLKMGQHYKIGNTDNIERRIRQITVALPEPATLIHAIRTDDPSGIEAYWHRRFADRRANGEWFRLTGDDVKAFRRRTFQ